MTYKGLCVFSIFALFTLLGTNQPQPGVQFLGHATFRACIEGAKLRVQGPFGRRRGRRAGHVAAGKTASIGTGRCTCGARCGILHMTFRFHTVRTIRSAIALVSPPGRLSVRSIF